jgi:hypothetical protein
MPKHEPDPSPEPPNSSLVLYVTEDGRSRIECRFEGETIWLTQALIAELFETTPQNITLHMRAIYDAGELLESATCKEHLQVRSEGGRKVSRSLKHYSLEAIIAVGYRVRSPRGTQFRQWATARLAEYLRKGFAMDDERLRNPPGPGVPDYFDELLERIRDIRASEKRMYLRVRDILALAADYAPAEQVTQEAFKIIQNKLTYAATGHTSAEIIAARADASKPNMGLTSWKRGVVRKTDVGVAKNYLSAQEIDELNRIVVMFLDFAEDNARRRKQIFLSDWKRRLDEFLAFNERRVLRGAGKVSHEAAIERASAEFDSFAARRRAAHEEALEAASQREMEQQAIRELEETARQVDALQEAERKKVRGKKKSGRKGGGSA